MIDTVEMTPAQVIDTFWKLVGITNELRECVHVLIEQLDIVQKAVIKLNNQSFYPSVDKRLKILEEDLDGLTTDYTKRTLKVVNEHLDKKKKPPTNYLYSNIIKETTE